MLNKVGGKVRLTFKLELDQLWIGTKGTSTNQNIKPWKHKEQIKEKKKSGS